MCSRTPKPVAIGPEKSSLWKCQCPCSWSSYLFCACTRYQLIFMPASFPSFKETNGKLGSLMDVCFAFSLVKKDFIVGSKEYPESATTHPHQTSLCHW